jgi:hypothetical protein
MGEIAPTFNTRMIMTTYPQGSLLWPKEPFQFKLDQSTVKALPGQSFWVTNSQLNQSQSNVVYVARMKQKVGYPFSLADAEKFFKP